MADPYTRRGVEDDRTSTPETMVRPHHGRWQTRPATLAAVFAGGMLGAASRVGVSAALPSLGDGFPWDTLAENLVGGLLLGLVFVVLVERFAPTSLLRPFLAVGFLGSFHHLLRPGRRGDPARP